MARALSGLCGSGDGATGARRIPRGLPWDSRPQRRLMALGGSGRILRWGAEHRRSETGRGRGGAPGLLERPVPPFCALPRSAPPPQAGAVRFRAGRAGICGRTARVRQRGRSALSLITARFTSQVFSKGRGLSQAAQAAQPADLGGDLGGPRALSGGLPTSPASSHSPPSARVSQSCPCLRVTTETPLLPLSCPHSAPGTRRATEADGRREGGQLSGDRGQLLPEPGSWGVGGCQEDFLEEVTLGQPWETHGSWPAGRRPGLERAVQASEEV